MGKNVQPEAGSGKKKTSKVKLGNVGGSKRKKERALALKAAKADATDFDFVGRVESIVVRDGEGERTFEFGLRGRGGKRQSFKLRASDSIALNVMAPIIIAAHGTESKIGVRTDPAEDGVPLVVEVASRPGVNKRT